MTGWLSHSWVYVKEDIVHRVWRSKAALLEGPESGRVQGAMYRIASSGHVLVTGF